MPLRNISLRDKKVKIVTLRREGSCCPVIKQVPAEIGEKDNLCVLPKSEWQALRKIMEKEA